MGSSRSRKKPASKKAAKQETSSNRTILIAVGAAAVVIVLGVLLWLGLRPEPEIQGVVNFPRPSQGHQLNLDIPFGELPPAGGVHDPAWQNCGIYDTPLNSAHAIHSMEHGSAWVTYRTDTPAESCVVPEGFPCDPFTNEGCAATEICAFDFVFGDDPVVQCYAPEAELDATCGECVGNCPAGFICNGPSGLPASCSEMCCDDADCAAGSICDRSDYEFLFGMPGLGACRVAQEPAQGDSCADAIAIEVGATAGARSGGGVKSGVNVGKVWADEASTKVRAEGIRIVRHGDRCWMNMRGG